MPGAETIAEDKVWSFVHHPEMTNTKVFLISALLYLLITYRIQIILFHIILFSLIYAFTCTKNFMIMSNYCNRPLYGDVIQAFTCHGTIRKLSFLHI